MFPVPKERQMSLSFMNKPALHLALSFWWCLKNGTASHMLSFNSGSKGDTEVLPHSKKVPKTYRILSSRSVPQEKHH